MESIRQLRLVRANAVKGRSAALTQLGEFIATALARITRSANSAEDIKRPRHYLRSAAPGQRD